MLPTPPPLPLYSDSADPVSFASALLAYRQGELSKDRQYTSRELSLHFLRELDLHSFPIQVQLKAVEDLAPDCPVPPSLLIPNLALVMAQHPPCNLSLTHTGTFTPLAHRITTPHTSTWQTNASHQRPSSTPNPSHPFHQREDIQCVACGTWGHSASRCSSLAKAALLQTYILANPSHAENAATAWRNLHSMNHHQAIAHHLQHLHPEESLPDLHVDDIYIYEANFL